MTIFLGLGLLMVIELIPQANGVRCYDVTCSPQGPPEVDYFCDSVLHPPRTSKTIECEYGCYSLNVTAPLEKTGTVYRSCTEEKIESESCYETDFSDVTTSTHGKGLLCLCKNNLCNIPIIITPVEGSSSKSQPLKTENALIPIPTPQKPETPLANVIKTDVSITKTPFYNVAHVKDNNKHHIMAKKKLSNSGVPAKFGINLVFITCTFAIIYYF